MNAPAILFFTVWAVELPIVFKLTGDNCGTTKELLVMNQTHGYEIHES